MKSRNTITKTLIGASALFCASYAPNGLLAAEAELNERRIEEVTVTAERREASVQDTSISITAITGDSLESFGIRNQEDLRHAQRAANRRHVISTDKPCYSRP